MKKVLYIMLLLLFCVGCSREAEQAPLYQQYASRPDLTVAQVSGFQLNDTVKTDVVILVADDTAAWRGLKEELDIRTSEGVTSWMGAIDHPQQRVKRSVRPAWRAIAVHSDLTIAFYRIEDSLQYQAILDYQLNELKHEIK